MTTQRPPTRYYGKYRGIEFEAGNPDRPVWSGGRETGGAGLG